MAKMDETELKSIISHEIKSAVGYLGSELSEEREQALNFYLGRPFGNEKEGRSSVVSRDVADTIEWILPSLLRIFTSADEVVRFEPRQLQDEQVAEQATDYINYILNQENSGFLLFHTWFKDALLQKTGIVKAIWEEGETVKEEAYAGLSQDEFLMVQADPTMEVIEHSEYPATQPPDEPEPMPAEGGQPPSLLDAGAAASPAAANDAMRSLMAAGRQPVSIVPAPVPTLHDIKVRRRKSYGCVKIYPVPPEEFLIARRARDLATAPFTGHRVKKTVSELIAQGYKRELVESLPDYDAQELTPEAQARKLDSDPTDSQSLDPSMREVSITECYIQVDYDGDGIAEMRKVTVGGSGDAGVILDNVSTDIAPFAAICPVLMPHQFYGLSVADLVMDLQLIKSTIMRQMMDGLYLANDPRYVVANEGDNTLDDLLTSRPGGIVRVKAQGDVAPLVTPWVGQQAFPMLEYVDGVREERTGVSKAFMGLDPNALNPQTATAYMQMTTAAQSRVELIARIFAETGVKLLFQLLLGLVTKHQNKAKIIRLRGEYVPMDPRTWTNEMDISVNVGLGTGDKDQELSRLAMIAGKQEQILAAAGPDNPLVGIDNLYNTYSRMIVAAGLKSADPYFKDPAKAPPQPPKEPAPDPKLIEAQTKIAIEQENAKAQIQLDQQKAAADIALEREKAAAQLQIERERAAAEIALRREIALMEANARITQAAAPTVGMAQ